MTTADRFWAKVEKTETCWLWRAHRLPTGYGQFYFDGQMRYAHRVAYELFVGPIPAGLTIDHLCRVRACVNPDHLEPVTNRENILRGVAPSALNARKTHCIRGHVFLRLDTRGHRDCGKCQAIRDEIKRRRRREAA